MAKYFSVTLPTGTTTVKVPNDWFPAISGGLLELPDKTTIPAGDVLASSFLSKRETPTKDRLVAAVHRAKTAFDEVFDTFRNEIRNPDRVETDDFDAFLEANTAYTLWRVAEATLAKHEENVRKSAEAAKKRKDNPTPRPEAKPKATPKKKK